MLFRSVVISTNCAQIIAFSVLEVFVNIILLWHESEFILCLRLEFVCIRFVIDPCIWTLLSQLLDVGQSLVFLIWFQWNFFYYTWVYIEIILFDLFSLLKEKIVVLASFLFGEYFVLFSHWTASEELTIWTVSFDHTSKLTHHVNLSEYNAKKREHQS